MGGTESRLTGVSGPQQGSGREFWKAHREQGVSFRNPEETASQGHTRSLLEEDEVPFAWHNLWTSESSGR